LGEVERRWWGAPDDFPPRKNRMVFGCLADTSGPLSATELKALALTFKGVDMILHAGPIGSLRVVEQLESLAPTAAVSGPSEDAIVRSSTYVRQVLRFGDQSLGLMCGYGKPQGQKAFLLRQFMEDKPGGGDAGVASPRPSKSWCSDIPRGAGATWGRGFSSSIPVLCGSTAGRETLVEANRRPAFPDRYEVGRPYRGFQ
jgi:hypothetical protein